MDTDSLDKAMERIAENPPCNACRGYRPYKCRDVCQLYQRHIFAKMYVAQFVRDDKLNKRTRKW